MTKINIKTCYGIAVESEQNHPNIKSTEYNGKKYDISFLGTKKELNELIKDTKDVCLVLLTVTEIIYNDEIGKLVKYKINRIIKKSKLPPGKIRKRLGI